jgi:hypothetical protein
MQRTLGRCLVQGNYGCVHCLVRSVHVTFIDETARVSNVRLGTRAQRLVTFLLAQRCSI